MQYNTAAFVDTHTLEFRPAAVGEIVTVNDMDGSTFAAVRVGQGGAVWGRNADNSLFGPYYPAAAGNAEGYAVNVPA